MLSLVENLLFQKNPLQDLLWNLNAAISTNESTGFITWLMIESYRWQRPWWPFMIWTFIHFLPLSETCKQLFTRHNYLPYKVCSAVVFPNGNQDFGSQWVCLVSMCYTAGCDRISLCASFQAIQFVYYVNKVPSF